jgi:carboxymethylenebutenolidase
VNRAIPLLLILWTVPAAAQRARVYLTDSEPSSIADPFAGEAGGAQPAGADLIQKFRERCPSVTIEREADKADYALAVEQQGGRNPLKRDNYVTVFDRAREVIHSSPAIRLASALDGACSAIRVAWMNKVFRETGGAPREYEAPKPGGARREERPPRPVATSSAQDWAKPALEKSTRHQEWVAIKDGSRVIHAFLVYPEVREKALAVVVIHENTGLTDWARSVADQLAAAGYIAIAPDLLSGKAPNGGKTSDFPDANAAREAIRALDAAAVIADLNAVTDYVLKLPAGNGKVAVAGFCWGGGQSFRFATYRGDLAAAFVFYGSGPEKVDRIRAPVYGFYGENDARINATLPATEAAMKAAGKKFETVTYAGAGHGFMRSGQAPDATPENRKAREDAWKRWLELLKGM